MSNPILNQLQENAFWNAQVDSIWPVTAFTIHRNLSRHLFPHKLEPLQREQIANTLKESLLKIEEGTFIDYTAISPLEREYIFEHFFAGGGFGQTQPGTGAVINKTCNFLGQINIDDHLSFHMIDAKGSWNETWNALLQIERALSQEVEYAYSSKFGYLTSRPHICGTGLKVTAYLHLPALSQMGQLNTALIEDVDKEALPRSLGGEEGEFTGDVIALTNRYAIGIAEDQILRHLFGSANRLMNSEKTLRAHIKEEKTGEIADRMSRSLGLLTHSIQLDTTEALNALSLLKLGVDLHWVEGISEAEITALMFTCRRGHLSINEETPLSNEDLLKNRANKIHSALENAKVNV